MRHRIDKTVAYAPVPEPDLPAQSARPPLRIPRSKSAAMQLIQQLCARGHHWWTRGTVDGDDRLAGLVYRMDQKFAILEPAKSRTRRRTRGVPTGHLVVYRLPLTDHWLWWLLVAGEPQAVQKLAARHRETLLSITDKQTPLRWADEYELRRGPRRSTTWWLQRKAANDVEGELRYLASAHGRPGERVDDLKRAVLRARRRPMFAGVRVQVGHALLKSKRRWHKTHSHQAWPAVDGPLPIMRALRLYDEPPEVVYGRMRR